MEQFTGKIELLKDGQITIQLDGDTGDIQLGGSGTDGDVILKDSEGRVVIGLLAQSGLLRVGGGSALGQPGPDGDIIVRNKAGQDAITLNGDGGDISLGGPGTDGDVLLRDKENRLVIHLRARDGLLRIGGGSAGGQAGPGGRIWVRDSAGKDTIMINGEEGNIHLGGDGKDGDLVLRSSANESTIHLNGEEGDMRLGGGGKDGDLTLRTAGNVTTIQLDGEQGNMNLGGEGRDGDLTLTNRSGTRTIHLDGDAGDIKLLGADCAEAFEVAATEKIDPGTVMVIGDRARLHHSTSAYDKKVAGVLSGAGTCKPGIVLGQDQGFEREMPLALSGKVYCKVDAQYSPIEVGDLLTTSDTPGHAMKADDPTKAFGAVIGKALYPLADGQGLIPILIALQ